MEEALQGSIFRMKAAKVELKIGFERLMIVHESLLWNIRFFTAFFTFLGGLDSK